jgi:hypothetical protein
MKSNEIQGKIGIERKTDEEIRKRDELDDPNTKIWKDKKYPRWRKEFIQMKIRNTIEWTEFCERKTKKT